MHRTLYTAAARLVKQDMCASSQEQGVTPPEQRRLAADDTFHPNFKALNFKIQAQLPWQLQPVPAGPNNKLR